MTDAPGRMTAPPEAPGSAKNPKPLAALSQPTTSLPRSKPQPVLDVSGEVPGSHPAYPGNPAGIVDAADKAARPTPTPGQQPSTSVPASPLS